MKVILETPHQVLLRFDRGEDVCRELPRYCETHTISAASFTAIGAAAEVVVSYYDLEQKRYEDHTVTENMEIVSVTGNIAMLDTAYVLHAHGTLSKRDLSVIGGHIKKLLVSATCEVSLQKLSGTMTRAHDETTGLNLLQ